MKRLRFTAAVLAACLFSVALPRAHAAPADPRNLHWNELPRVLRGRHISLHLSDGATLEGKYSSLQADALTLQVQQTSDPVQHPKGAATIARSVLGPTLTLVRHSGWKGRIIGTIAGGAIAAIVVGVIYTISKNEVDGWSATSAGVAAASGGTLLGIGHLIGWLFDYGFTRPEQVVQILPD